MHTTPATVSERIHASMDELSHAERRAARALLSDYPASGLGTSHSLAAAASVSAPTVVRLATRLGFTGFSQMQNQLRSEVSNGLDSPVLRTMAHGTGHRHASGFGQAMHRRMDALEATMRLIPAAEITAATELISRCPSRVLVTGGFFSSSIARIFTLQLSQLRPDVTFVEEPLRRDAGQVLDAKRHSVLVVFDLRRYEAGSLILARNAKQAGLDVVLITDRWMSPISSLADVVLSVEVEAVPFDTFVALLAVVEVLIESTMAELGSKGLRRMKQWEKSAVGHTVTHELPDDV